MRNFLQPIPPEPFDAWWNEADAICVRMSGLNLTSFPDEGDSYEAFASELTPAEYVLEVLADNGHWDVIGVDFNVPNS